MDDMSKHSVLALTAVKCFRCKRFMRLRKSPYGELIEYYVCGHCLTSASSFEDCMRFVKASQPEAEAEQEALRRL